MFDVLIIGAGPAGLSAGLILGRACRSVLLLDSGEPRNRAARHVNGYLGIEAAHPREHRRRGLQQLARYHVDCVLDRADKAECIHDPTLPTLFMVQGTSGETFIARKLLFATGVRDHLPDIPGVTECYGRSVHHCPYCDAWEHRGQRLAVLGSNINAVSELAYLLRGWTDRVIVLTNGEPLGAIQRERFTRLEIQCEEQKVLRLWHEEGNLRKVCFIDQTTLDVDALFFSAGSEAASDLPGKLGCTTTNKGLVETNLSQRTDAPGVFLAGDADGDVQFAIVAAAEGATAAMAINQELSKEDRELLCARNTAAVDGRSMARHVLMDDLRVRKS